MLSFNYEGAGGILRSLEVHVDPKPKETSSTGASFVLRIAAGEAKQVKLSLRILLPATLRYAQAVAVDRKLLDGAKAAGILHPQ